MKRIIKKSDSLVVTKGLKYKKGQPDNNRQLREILEAEQNYFCAYTECRLTAETARDVEHFNPTLKNQPNDHYGNWFAVSHRWNNAFKRDELWETIKDNILKPTDEDLEKRLWYDEVTGWYQHEEEDLAAHHLVKYLQLNHIELVNQRNNHIQLIKDLYEEAGLDSDFDYWLNNPTTKKGLIEYRRAMETVFGVILS